MKQEIKAVTETGTEVFFFAHSFKPAIYYAKRFTEKYVGAVKLYWMLENNPFKRYQEIKV